MSDVQSSHGNSESVSLYEVIVEHATGVPLSHVYIAADQSGISENRDVGEESEEEEMGVDAAYTLFR